MSVATTTKELETGYKDRIEHMKMLQPLVPVNNNIRLGPRPPRGGSGIGGGR